MCFICLKLSIQIKGFFVCSENWKSQTKKIATKYMKINNKIHVRMKKNLKEKTSFIETQILSNYKNNNAKIFQFLG